MADSDRVTREFRSASTDFLLTDLDVAMTFLDVAATTHDPETVRRNHRNARIAYDTVLSFLDRLVLLEGDRLAVERKLGELRARFSAAGCDV